MSEEDEGVHENFYEERNGSQKQLIGARQSLRVDRPE